MTVYQQNPFVGLGHHRNWKYYLNRFIHNRSALNRLLLINIAIYVVILLSKLILSITGFLFNIHDLPVLGINTITEYLACPASFQVLLHRPWTLVTSIFLHINFSHIFFNMMMLYVTGKIFLQYLSDKQLYTTYLLGGIIGNLLYMLAFNFFPVFQNQIDVSVALGASGSIMAIMVGITVYRPNHQLQMLFIGSIKLMWITLIFIGIDLISIPSKNPGGHIAHLGGAIYGACSVLLYLNYSTIFKRIKIKTKKKKFATSSNYQYSGRPISDEEYNTQRAEREKKTDSILDKISKNGYESLSKEEKDFLFFAGKNR